MKEKTKPTSIKSTELYNVSVETSEFTGEAPDTLKNAVQSLTLHPELGHGISVIIHFKIYNQINSLMNPFKSENSMLGGREIKQNKCMVFLQINKEFKVHDEIH